MSPDLPPAAQNPLRLLHLQGQSLWLDNIRRGLITSGALRRMVDEDGLRGITSNPSIFQQAIAGGSDYAPTMEALAALPLDARGAYEALAVQDIRDAADILSGVYSASARRDGYVSLEVSPHLAHDTAGTVAEARRLWKMIGRPNVMIKVPATSAGMPAVRELIGCGINVNITLLFARDAYARVAEAWLDGLEQLARAGGDVAGVASVASFFISRIDSAVDAAIEKQADALPEGPRRAALQALAGTVAIANARLAYRHYQEVIEGPRWQPLGRLGAQPQRLLWASTSTKNPRYRDVLYVEELIGPDTVNTVPPATIDAFRDHGKVRPSLQEHVEAAGVTLGALEGAGIALPAITDQLLTDGLAQFSRAFDTLIDAVAADLTRLRADALSARR